MTIANEDQRVATGLSIARHLVAAQTIVGRLIEKRKERRTEAAMRKMTGRQIVDLGLHGGELDPNKMPWTSR